MRKFLAKKSKPAGRLVATRRDGKKSKKIGLPPGTLVHVGKEFNSTFAVEEHKKKLTKAAE